MKIMTTLKFNVAQLLREAIGARRDYDFEEDRLPLDENLALRRTHGRVRFTRTASGVFAHTRVSGVVRLVCVRSLEEFDRQVQLEFADEFHSVIDVVTGFVLPKPTEDDPYLIDETHMVDLGEAIREYVLLDLPPYPVSEAYRDAPINYTVESDAAYRGGDHDEPVDERLAALKAWAERQDDRNRTS